MEERGIFPEFPQLYTESDAEQLASLQAQSDRLKELYHSHFHDPVWEAKPWYERFARRALDPPRQHLPGVARIAPHLTPESIRDERYRLEEEIKELDKYRHAQERAPSIMDEMFGLAVGGNFIEDKTKFFQLFPDAKRFPDEMLDYLMNFGMTLAKADPESLLSGDFWHEAAPGTEADYRAYWERNNLSSEQVMSSIAFSQDVEQIRQALTYAFPPSEHVAIPEDRMSEEWYKHLEEIFERYKLQFDRENPDESMEMLSLVQLYSDGMPHSFISEDGTPMVDENGEPLQGRLYPSSGNIGEESYVPATVWYGEELMGVYDETKGEFVPWNIVTMQPYATEEEQEDPNVVRSIFNNIGNRMVMYGYGVRIAVPMIVAGQWADILNFDLGALTVFKGIIRGQLKRIPYHDWIEEKITEGVSGLTVFQRLNNWRDDQVDKGYELASEQSGKVIEAQIHWWTENKLPTIEGIDAPITDRVRDEGVIAVLKDRPYLAHLMTEAVASMAISMGTMLGVTKLTKNPNLGRIASGILIGSAETGRVVQILHEEGIPPEDIAMWTQALVPILGGLEVAGAEIMLRAVSPRLYHEMFGRKFTQELIRGTVREMVRKGIRTATIHNISETMIEVSVQAIGNAVLHHEGAIDSVLEGLDEVAIRTSLSFLGSSMYGGYTHTSYLHQNFVEAGLYDTHMAQVAQLEQAGLSHEMADVLSALKLVETAEGAKAKAKTYRQLEPTFRQAANSPELIRAVHEVESQFLSNDTKAKALDQQIDVLEKAAKHHERVIARTTNPTKLEKRHAILEQTYNELNHLRSEQEATRGNRESLVKQLAYLDTIALTTGKMTQRLWDTRPADARRVYLKEIGLEGDEVGIAFVEKPWDQLPIEIQAALESHESQRIVDPSVYDPNTLSADQTQQIEAIRQQQEALDKQSEPNRVAFFKKSTELLGLKQKKKPTVAEVKRIATLNTELANLRAQIEPIQSQIYALQELERSITHLPPLTPIDEVKYTDTVLGEMSPEHRGRVDSLLQALQDSPLRFDIKEIRIDKNLPFPGYVDKLTTAPEQAKGLWIEESKTLVLEPNFTDNTFYHEIAHAISTKDINEGRYDFWGTFSPKFVVQIKQKIAELKKKRIVHPRPLGGDADLVYVGWETYRNAEEAYARAFSAYFRQVSQKNLQSRDVIDLHTYQDAFNKFFTIGRKMQEGNIARDMVDAQEAILHSQHLIEIIDNQIAYRQQQIDKIESDVATGKLVGDAADKADTDIIDMRLHIFSLENSKEQEVVQLRSQGLILESLEAKLTLLEQGDVKPPSGRDPTSVTSPDQFPRDNTTGLAKLPSLEAILAQRALHVKKNPELAAKISIPIETALLDDKSLSYRDMSTMPVFRKWFSGTLDSKYILMNMESRTGKPFYTLYDLMRQIHGQVEHASRIILQRLSKVPHYQQIINDEVALARVEQLIASENPKFKVAIPDNITQTERDFARAVKDVFQMYRPKVNVLAFEKAYQANPNNVDGIMKMMALGDEHRATVERATTMTNRGELAARNEYIMNIDWGVIEGYTPWMTVIQGLNRSSKEYGSKRRGEGRLKHRYGIEIPDMSNTLTERIEQYVRQIESQWQLKDILDTFETHLDDVAPKMRDGGAMFDEMSRLIQELQHFPPPEAHTGGSNFIRRSYATVSPAVFHTNPRVLLRNFWQFLAFNPWRGHLHKGIRARKLVDANLYQKSLLYYTSCVSQMTGIQRGIFFHGTKPLYAEAPLIGKPMYNLTRLLNRVAPYGRSDDIPRHWSFNTGMVRVHEAIQSYRKHGNIEQFIRESGIETLRKPQQDLALQYLAIGEDYVNMGIEGLQRVSGYEAAALYVGKEIADLTHFNYERSFRAPIEMGTAGRTIFNLLTFTRSYWQRHYHNALKWADTDWAEHYTPRQRVAAFKDSLAMIVVGGVISSYLRELYGRPYKSYWIGDIMWWEMGGLMIGAINQLGSAIEALAVSLDPHTEEEHRWRAVRTVIGFFGKDQFKLYIPFATNFLESLEAGAMRGHLPEEIIDYDTRAYQAIRAHFDKKYTPSEIEVIEIELMDAILKGIFSTPPPELDRVIEAVQYLDDRRQEIGVAYTDEPGKVGDIYTIGNFLSDVDSHIRSQNIPRDMVTADVGFHPLVEFALDYLYLQDEFNDIPTSPARLRTEWRKQNPEFELLLIYWERFSICQIPYGSAAGQRIEEALDSLDKHFGVPPTAGRRRLTNWRYAIIP